MADITIDRVTKRFGGFTAVADMDIRFADGEVTCLLGPSGCGKTTLMRMIAGLETVTSGRVLFGDRDVTRLPPRKRNIGMVFQYPVMYPTLSVRQNIDEPLRHDRSLSRQQRSRRVEEMLDLLDMQARANAHIDELDAGSRQKVAVGRAVARHSDIVLFDEPTTNVEVNAKLLLIRAFKEVTARLQQTIIYVTHDQTEAMTLADRIALMKDGRIIQYASPRALYDNPNSTFGGWFLGNPGMNFIDAAVTDAGIESPVLAEPMACAAGTRTDALEMGIRPEHVELHTADVPGSVPAILLDRTIGVAGRYLLRVRVGDTRIAVKTGLRPQAALGETVHLRIPAEHVLLFNDGQRAS